MLPDPTPFEFIAARQAEDMEAALVTVTAVSGASVRNPGAHMAVAADGRWTGSLSGGCIEAAIVAEAQAAIAAGRPRRVCFGAGSPFIDIRLPCGGSVDLLISPVVGESWAEDVLNRLVRREAVTLSLTEDGPEVRLSEGGAKFSTGWAGESFTVNHIPRVRLQIVGHGGSVMALARLAQSMPIEVCILSPDVTLIGEAAGEGVITKRLKTPQDEGVITGDPWTATVFYFHDHEWEAKLLSDALSLPGFFVGAMGSRSTNENRLGALRDYGLQEEAIAKLQAPIGLFHSSRDPATLALSTLAQIVQAFDRECVAGG